MNTRGFLSDHCQITYNMCKQRLVPINSTCNWCFTRSCFPLRRKVCKIWQEKSYKQTLWTKIGNALRFWCCCCC